MEKAAQQPPAVPVRVLQGRFEGIPAQQRGEGVVVEAEAARHGRSLLMWHRGAAYPAQMPAQPLLRCAVMLVFYITLAQQLERFGRVELFCNCYSI